jgi:two-component system LytT family response regulator
MLMPIEKHDAPVRTLSVIIVDDESVARARLRRLLSDEPDMQVVAECENGKDAVHAILDRAPDLVFLDIEMPELNGFDVLRTLPEETLPAFVFVTAFSSYALDAFAVDALDYLLKPFDAERFQVTVRRARERLGLRSERQELLTAIREVAETQREIKAAVGRLPETSSPQPSFLERIAVKADGRVFFVRVNDVDYMEAAANYVKIRVGSEAHLIRERLGDLAARLDPTRFARIHRSTIVNLDRIKEIQPWFSGDALVILRDGQKLRLSRMFRAGLELGTRSRL